MLDVSDWYDSSYSSLNFRVPGEFCVFLLFIWACLLWLVRSVILVTIVIASIVVLWKSLIFRSIFVTTGFLDRVFRCLYCLFCNFLNLCCYLSHNGYYQDDHHD